MGTFKVLKRKEALLVEHKFFVPMRSYAEKNYDRSSEFAEALRKHGYHKPTDAVTDWQYNFVSDGYDVVIRAWVEKKDETKPATS